MDDIAEEDRKGRQQERESDREDDEQAKRDRQKEREWRQRNLEEEHDDEDGNEREDIVHGCRKDLLHGEHIAVDLDLLQKRCCADDGRQSLARRIAHE